MKPARLLLPLLLGPLFLAAGCSHPYYPPPPPPAPFAYQGPPPLIQLADRNGFGSGTQDGARDVYQGRGYRPEHDRRYHDCPGYDPHFGPFQPYRDAFRSAYLRGYDKGFNRL